jgi:hypothetical protein
MRLVLAFVTVATLSVLGPLAARVPAQYGAAAEATTKIVASAQAFLATLDDAGRAKVQLSFDDPVKKSNWSNLPIGMVKRSGLRMGDLTPPQKAAAMALLERAFSPMGYRKIVEVVRGDEILRTSGGGANRPAFGEAEYFVVLVGPPSATAPWMLQFGGHHLAVNMTMAGERATLAPTLTGAQPATYTFEGKTITPLGREVERAFALMAALDEAQRKQAIIGAQMADLVLGPGKEGQTIQPEGLKVSAMSAAQQAILLDIVREWAGIANDAFAKPRLDEIRARLPESWFAWSGPTTPGSAAYFRIQGPTLVIEYAPQRSVDHIHTIYRDPTNDYGSGYAAR